METLRIRATVAAILSSSMALRTPVEPVAPTGLVSVSRRHDDRDAAEVQDGPELELPQVQLQPAAPPEDDVPQTFWNYDDGYAAAHVVANNQMVYGWDSN